MHIYNSICLFILLYTFTCKHVFVFSRFPELYGALCRPPVLESGEEGGNSNTAITDSSSGDGYKKLSGGLGAEVVLVPSAFTVRTGSAHWEILLRARAIENQCYVVAAAQVGRHNEKRESYGHSVIIDPWGTIVASCPSIIELKAEGQGEGGVGKEVVGLNCHVLEGVGSICVAPFEREVLNKTRESMPVQSHRRPDIYYG